MKKSYVGAGVLSALLLVSVPVTAKELNWAGCGITKNAFMEELAAAYTQATGNPVKLSGGGATMGIRAVAAGTADIGGTCRLRLHDGKGNHHAEEKDADLHQVAWDALVVVVSPANPVGNITTDNLKKIYQGGIESWKDLGGEDKPIALVEREGKESGVGYTFRKLVFQDGNIDFAARSLKEKSSGGVEKKLEKLPNGMAIDGVSSARKNKEVKILTLDGVPPSRENIASGSYPLYRPLYLVVNKNASPEAKALVDFALSPQGQEIIAKQGTVNLEEGKALNPLWKTKVEKLNF